MTNSSTKSRSLKNQLRRLNKQLERLKKLSTRLSWYRLAIFLIGAGLTIVMIWVDEMLSWGALTITFIAFNIAAYYHRRIELSIKKHKIWLNIKATQIARIKLDWKSIPASSSFSASSEHPFELDLDISGDRSLHQLIDISISQNGSQRLRDWLLQQKPDLKNIQKKQKIIRELTPLTLFRDKLLLNFGLISKERLEGKKLLDWLEQGSPSKNLKWILPLSGGLAIVNWILFLLHTMGSIPPYWIFSFMSYVLLYFLNRRSWASLFDDVEFLEDEFKKSVAIFRYLENFNYRKNKNLANLCAPFSEKKNRPSTQLRRLTYVTIAIGLRMNFIMGAILNAALPWDFYWASRLSKRKSDIKKDFPGWLDICFELEAFISLANFAFLNPGYSFPQFNIGQNTKVKFEAKELGHPLIPPAQKVCNNFSLQDMGHVILITGSNMSGKSTFLRTLGINLCLAYTGAPVNASYLKTSLLRIFTCINVSDSVTDGISQFYAEVKRLKKLLLLFESQKNSPIFFLIDEIYRGTNNRERLIGSRSFIRSLIGRKGLGAISTHDLELTKIEEDHPNLKNYHFREEVKNGKMKFDYKLHPGPCPTTNALKIIRMEGLPVDEEIE